MILRAAFQNYTACCASTCQEATGAPVRCCHFECWLCRHPTPTHARTPTPCLLSWRRCLFQQGAGRHGGDRAVQLPRRGRDCEGEGVLSSIAPPARVRTGTAVICRHEPVGEGIPQTRHCYTCFSVVRGCRVRVRVRLYTSLKEREQH